MRRTVAVLLALLLLPAGCGRDAGPDVEFLVAAPSALFDAPLGVRLTGVPAGQSVTVTASATDTTGAAWASSAVFRPDASGTVDPATAAPESGTYTGAHDTGLLWSMSSPVGSLFRPAESGVPVRLTAAVKGRTVAESSVLRQVNGPGVTSRPTAVAAEGFAGVFYAPAASTGRRPAVLAFGGSSGGTSGGVLMARAFAAKGYPSLGLGYFGVPGTPDNLDRIPLEYFATALRWLARQPGVDPSRLVVFGESRGSEAALLLGVYFPGLVHSVIAGSPSSAANPALHALSHPAWTLGGRPIPGVSPADYGHPQAAEGVIPVERIRGPLLLICGQDDQLWPSCGYQSVIVGRRAHRPDVDLRRPGAGHNIADLVPNLPIGAGIGPGGDQQADALGRLADWPAVLTFLS